MKLLRTLKRIYLITTRVAFVINKLDDLVRAILDAREALKKKKGDQ